MFPTVLQLELVLRVAALGGVPISSVCAVLLGVIL